MFRSFSLSFATFLFFSSLPGLHAASPVASEYRRPEHGLFQRSTLTLDRFGLRAMAKEHGITFGIEYTGEVLGNTTGGIKRGAIYEGLMQVEADISTAKLFGFDQERGDVVLHVNWLSPHGTSISEKYVGDLGTVSGIDAEDSIRLFELWIEPQIKLGNTEIFLRMGQLAADEEFDVSRYGSLFVHSGFGLATPIAANFPVPDYPLSALGIRLKVEHPFAAGKIYGMAAVYDGNAAPGIFPDPSPNAARSNEFNHYNTHWAIRRDEGAIWFFEAGYIANDPEEEEDESDSASSADGKSTADHKTETGHRRFASYKVGAVYHTDEFSKIYDTTVSDLASSIAPLEIRGADHNYAIYFLLEQELWPEAHTKGDGFGAFVRGAFAPNDRNFFSKSIEAGVVYRGLFQEDAQDQLGIGAGYFDISHTVTAAVHDANRADGTSFAEPDYECAIEATYKFRVTPWWSLQPELQWIIHPGGSGALDDALVVGLRTTVTF